MIAVKDISDLQASDPLSISCNQKVAIYRDKDVEGFIAHNHINSACHGHLTLQPNVMNFLLMNHNKLLIAESIMLYRAT